MHRGNQYNSALETAHSLLNFMLSEIKDLSTEGDPSYDELISNIRVLCRLTLNNPNASPEKIEKLLVNLRKSPLIVPIPGGKIFLDFEFLRDLSTLALGGWEMNNLNIMSQLLKPEDIVFDIGAHIGHFTILAANTVGSGGTVYAFEPAPRNFKRLCENINLNNFKARVETFPVAISDKEGEAEFYDDGSSGGTEYSMFSKKHGEHGIAFTSQTISLDHFVAQQKVSKIDFIKIDTEGAELSALFGATDIFNKFENICMLIELHPWVVHPQEICDFLAQHQFRLYDVGRDLVLFPPDEANSRFVEGGDILVTKALLSVKG